MYPITIGGGRIQHVLGPGILGIYYIYRMVVTITYRSMHAHVVHVDLYKYYMV